MMNNMRSFSQSWIMRGFFAILILAFVLIWGVSDVFQGGKMVDNHIATVGNVKISLHDYMKESRLQTMALQQMGQEIDSAVMQQRVLQSLVQSALLEQEADHLGLAISDQQIVDIIKSSPTFNDKDGQFSRQIFEAVARAEGMTPKDFEEELRKEARRNQLIQLVSTGISLPKAFLVPLYNWQNQKRVVDLLTVNPASFKSVPAPKPDEMKAFYDEHQNDFTKPEQRDVTVLILSEEALRPKIKLTDEEIQTGFAARGMTGSKLPTKAETEKIMEELKTEKSLDEFNKLTTIIENNITGGSTLEDLAKKHDLKIEKVLSLERDGETASKPNITADALAETVDEAFKMEPNEDPILSQLKNGEFIAVRVDKVNESRVMPYEEVEKQIAALVLADNQRNAAKEAATALIEKINGGATLAQVAKEGKYELKTGIMLDRSKPEDQNVSIGTRALAFASELNKPVLAPGNNGSYAVLITRQIIEPKASDLKEEELNAFKNTLERSMVNDMQVQYLSSLEKRYRVELNKAALEALQK